MKTSVLKKIFLVIAFSNLLFSIYLTRAANINGDVTVEYCNSGCLVLSVPDSLPAAENGLTTTFLNTAGGKILISYLYPLQSLEVSDSRDPSLEGGFNVDLSVSSIINSALPSATIEKNGIGIISYNNDPNEDVGTDNFYYDASVFSEIDPDQISPNGVNLTYSEILSNYESLPFSMFQNDDPEPAPPYSMRILEAPPQRRPGNIYKMGLAFVINTPASPEQTLVDGTYQFIATYTLTE